MTAIHELQKLKQQMDTQEKIEVNQAAFFALLVSCLLELCPAGLLLVSEPAPPVETQPKNRGRKAKLPVVDLAEAEKEANK